MSKRQKTSPHIYRIPRTYRFSPDIVAKLEANSQTTGQDMTAIIERALRIYFAASEPAIPTPTNGNRKA